MVTLKDLTELQGQLFAVHSRDAGLVRQEITDAITSFSERDQESLHKLVGRAEGIIEQERNKKALPPVVAVMPT